MDEAGFSTMTVDLRAGDSLSLAGAHIEFIQKSGRQARLRVTAPRSLAIKKISHSAEDDSVDSRYKHGAMKPA
jgi:hypothetical protein